MMRFARMMMWLGMLLLVGNGPVWSEEIPDDAPAKPMPIMVDITDSEPPSDDEWKELHEESSRGLFGDGGLGDFSSQIIRVNGTRYWTTNATEGTLASYGKKIMGKPQHFDRMGHIAGVESSIDGNSWKARYVVNSDALMKLSGSRFEEFAGVSADVAAAGKKQIEVTFLVVDLPKEQVIERLNADVEALEYFDGLLTRLRQHRSRGLKTTFEKEPPTPQVVIGNVVVLSGEFSKAWELKANAVLRTIMTTTGAKLELTRDKEEAITYLSPVVRGYRMYSVEFKVDDEGQLIRRAFPDSGGQKKLLPQVFDLTPEK